jgi:hypothetical protein
MHNIGKALSVAEAAFSDVEFGSWAWMRLGRLGSESKASWCLPNLGQLCAGLKWACGYYRIWFRTWIVMFKITLAFWRSDKRTRSTSWITREQFTIAFNTLGATTVKPIIQFILCSESLADAIAEIHKSKRQSLQLLVHKQSSHTLPSTDTHTGQQDFLLLSSTLTKTSNYLSRTSSTKRMS